MKFFSSVSAIGLLAIIITGKDATPRPFSTELLSYEGEPESSANSFEGAQENPRERRKTVGQHLDTHIANIQALPHHARNGLKSAGKGFDNAGRAIKRKGKNIGKAIQSRRRRKTVGQHLDKGIATASHPVHHAKKGLKSAGKGLNNAGRALKRKGNNIGKAIQSRRRRDTVGQGLDKGIATVAHPVENVKKGLDSVGKGLDNAGKAQQRKGENVGKAIQSRRRRDTVGQSLDKGIANVEALPQNAIEGLDNAGKALRRKGENVGKAIESRRRRHTSGDKVKLDVL